MWILTGVISEDKEEKVLCLYLIDLQLKNKLTDKQNQEMMSLAR